MSAPWLGLGYVKTLQYYHQYLVESAKSGKERDARAYLGRHDLFFLLAFILNRKDLLHPWLFARCREVQKKPDGMLDLWARGHYKSTIITFGLTIFDIINDPETTIAIFSHTKPVAKKFLAQIKAEMENNPALPELWPDVFFVNPKTEAQMWSEDKGIIVNRQGNPKEATLEAHGLVDGMPTGRHFRKMVYDDVVTIESVSTPEQIAKTTYAFQMSDNLGSKNCIKRYVGTRYHLFDTYHEMIQSEIAQVRKHPATKDGTEHGEPVLLSREALAEKRKIQGPFVFSSQMLLDPTADKAMGFRQEWLTLGDTEYGPAMKFLFRFIIVDPAGGKQRKNNDFTTFWVVGYGSDEKYRVLDMRRDRMSLSQRWETLLFLHERWKPHVTAYEEYGMQADIEYYKIKQKELLYEFDITPLGGSMPKNLRIMRLVPLFENGWKEGDEPRSKIILPTTMHQVDYQGIAHDLVQDFIKEEYTAFPVLKHDDMLDGLARIVDLEGMGAIKTPTITTTPPTGTRLQEGLRRTNHNRGNSGGWTTA